MFFFLTTKGSRVMLKILKLMLVSLLVIAASLFILDRLFPLDKDRLLKPSSSVIYDRNGNLLRIHLSEDGFLRFPIKPEQINDDIKKLLLGYEDKYFYSHFGINPFSIVRALWFNLQHKRVVGASTITMQVARMAHHKPRTVINKISEIFMAFQLEYYYTKEEILEFYLNNTPYGSNIEGFASAAYAYFGLPVESLSVAQIAYLVSIPKNPNLNTPKNMNRVNRLKNIVLDRINNHSIAYMRAKSEMLMPKRTPLPFLTPHLTSQIKTPGLVQTTIDLVLQQRIERILKEQTEINKKLGVYNGAAVVIDNETMKILAYVGSHNFHDKIHEGEIDGIKALISPGSTLKPFVYARALEQGYITPLKKLFDIPLDLSGYMPENYSKSFTGDLTASEALQHSLNIPAIDLDNLLGDRSLYHLLKEADIRSIDQEKIHYGSGLTLGGCGIRLIDIVELFAALSNQGVYRKSSYLKDEESTTKKQLVSAEAAYLISNILADAPRNNFSSSWEYMKNATRFAFKTGTSAHAKDLLSIGYTPKYTVGVWFGNFNPNRVKKKKASELTGINTAFPTLNNIMNALHPQGWYMKPEGIIEDVICQDALQVGSCQNRIKDQLISGILPHTPCKLFRSEILTKLMKDKVISSIADLSSHECYNIWRDYKPHLKSPIDQKKYTQNGLLPEEYRKILLQCYSFKEDNKIHFFIDDENPIVKTSGEKHYRYFTPGSHTVKCLDQSSQISEASIELQVLK